jgi:hypothetical protein
MASEELIYLRDHLASLEAFRKSKGHDAWVASRKEDLREIEAEILDLDPIDRAGEIEQFKLRGEKRYMEVRGGLVGYFDMAIERVKDAIAELEDREAGGLRQRETSAVSPNEDMLLEV